MGFLKARWRGISWIALTYFYFLIYAQFGFLHRISGSIGQASWEAILGTMAVCGVVGALAAGRWFHPDRGPAWLMAGFAGSGVGSLLAATGDSRISFLLAAALSGFWLAVLTVVLVGVLRAWFPLKGAGLMCGLGTGLAYFLSNIPAVFTASPTVQCIVATAACLAALAMVRGMGAPHTVREVDGMGRRPAWKALAGTLTLFLVLIFADSAAFTQIQESAALKQASWFGDGRLWSIGLIHFLAAVAGGFLMDHGRDRLLYLLAFSGLYAGWSLLTRANGSLPATLVYASGVSLYSCALVAFSLVFKSRYRTVSRAGLVFAVAGWLGSALGIGMVNDLGRVPGVFWLLALVVLVAGLALKGKEVLA